MAIPMQSPADTGPDSELPENEGGDADVGTELCIRVTDDDGLSFYVEKDGQVQGQMQECSDIGQALKAALDAYKRLQQGGQAQGQFDAGFGAPAVGAQGGARGGM